MQAGHVSVILCAYLSGQVDLHGCIWRPVTHGKNVDSEFYVAWLTLVLHILKWFMGQYYYTPYWYYSVTFFNFPDMLFLIVFIYVVYLICYSQKVISRWDKATLCFDLYIYRYILKKKKKKVFPAIYQNVTMLNVCQLHHMAKNGVNMQP